MRSIVSGVYVSGMSVRLAMSGVFLAQRGLRYAEPPTFTAFEMLLLGLLVILSAGAFFLRFSKVLSRIQHSKKDADFSLRPLGRRVRAFFWEVLCQAKVIKERPLPGLAHAFVFWGFCAFALVIRA